MPPESDIYLAPRIPFAYQYDAVAVLVDVNNLTKYMKWVCTQTLR